MNNESFSKLVQERSGAKSTKEIAREAVENEFARRKSRRRGRGGGSSSEEEDNDSDNDEAVNKKEDVRPLKRPKKEKDSTSQRYRDRAKERREGKNADYQETMAILQGVNEAEDGDGSLDKTAMSKYLGGDEAHTHLVRGLDIALAKKVKREMGIDPDAEQDEDLDVLLVQARREHQQASASSLTIRAVKDAIEAIEFLQRVNRNSLSSELGLDIFQYLRRMHLPTDFAQQGPLQTSAAGLAIQRATVTFAAHGHPHDRIHAWETPRENMHASIIAGAAEGTNAPTPLEHSLLERIKSVLREPKQSNQPQQNTDHSRPIQNLSLGKKDQRSVATKPADMPNGDESDDDIFQDVGDYVPAMAAKEGHAETSDSNKTTKKVSFFSGLTDTSADVRHRARVSNGIQGLKNLPRNTPMPHVIDRDLLGTRSKDAANKSTPLQGISVEYGGGYGEEMDVDFDGRFARDKEDRTIKKGRGKPKIA